MLKRWNVALVVGTFLLSHLRHVHHARPASSPACTASPSRTWATSSSRSSSSTAVATLHPALHPAGRCSRPEAELESHGESRGGVPLQQPAALVGIAFSVLWGTLFPILSEAVRGTKITVGPPFFNRVNVPLGLLLLALTGIGPLIAWRKASAPNLQRQFAFPVGRRPGRRRRALGARHARLAPLMTSRLAGFVVGTIAPGVLAGHPGPQPHPRRVGADRRVRAAWSARNRRRYGGYIVHVGIVVYFVAFAGMAFKVTTEATLKPGESVELASPFGHTYTLHPRGRFAVPSAQPPRLGRHGRGGARREFPTDASSPRSASHVDQLRAADVRAVDRGRHSERAPGGPLRRLCRLGERHRGSGRTAFTINPLVWWVWAGGFILAFGGLITMWPGGGTPVPSRRNAQAGLSVSSRRRRPWAWSS